jgi:hypothetical protein
VAGEGNRLASFERTAMEALKLSIAVVVALNVINAVAMVQEPWGRPELVWLLLDSEGNLSTWFTSTLFGAAALLALVVRHVDEDRHARGWAQVAGVLLLISVEEVAGLHERLDSKIGAAMDTDGFLHFAWIVPVGVVAALALAVLWQFVRSLAPSTRRALAIGAIVYVAGALGMEAVSGWWTSEHGNANIGFLLLSTVEENLEMAAALVLAAALGRYALTAASLEVIDLSSPPEASAPQRPDPGPGPINRRPRPPAPLGSGAGFASAPGRRSRGRWTGSTAGGARRS